MTDTDTDLTVDELDSFADNLIFAEVGSATKDRARLLKAALSPWKGRLVRNVPKDSVIAEILSHTRMLILMCMDANTTAVRAIMAEILRQQQPAAATISPRPRPLPIMARATAERVDSGGGGGGS